jgi:hypothetical protein
VTSVLDDPVIEAMHASIGDRIDIDGDRINPRPA